ncbi:LysE family translocator [Pseudoalteromonas carrageenovora]|uniref:LysE family translocator n=1 Tax=Pseudoalteromonas TaxID=53246 RepID=UPI00073228CC|nr:MULTISPECIES: LysE family translocator [Pseudoalteromonas]KTF17583.1 amino acid transporter [Pseudoalteromonas sp. H103]MDO6636195.1 LysE family translocator [Pseudoalteromonas carrageenovora]MDO6648523.1 LysE family translocator [Pseudoalteromonas carrageenovora]|tara:strand:- start:1884 stop:2528 length:645 start_codon:yes stop_codon:yes gene_type:complete
MINPDFLVSFLLASFLMAVAPGPSNAFLMAQTFANGRAAGMQSAFGFALGGVVHTFFAVIGLSAVLKASATAYSAVQYAGAAYLCYLGFMMIKDTLKRTTSTTDCAGKEKPHISTSKKSNVMFQAMMTEVLNPKVALFFIAFIPQFVDPTLSSATFQLAFFGLLYPIFAFPIDCTYIYFGDKIAQFFRNHPNSQLWIDRVTGIVFIALAINLLY